MLNRLKQYGAVFSLSMSLCVSTALAETITIPEGRSELVNVSSEMTEVIVANPDVADAYVHDPQKVSIMGRELGVTDVRILGEDGLLRDITVQVTYDLPTIRKTLSELLPYESISVEMLNANIVLTGSVSSASVAEQAVRIVSEYIQPSISPSGQTNGANNNTDYKVMNLLEVTSGQQVMLRVRVGEMRRAALKNLGLDLQAVKNGGNTVFNLATGGGLDAFIAGGTTPLGTFNVDIDDSRGIFGGTYTNSSGDALSGVLDALERDSLFKILAEPNLVSLSGEKSTFLAGGEIPVPVPTNEDNITIQFKKYGVSVAFTPYVLAENRIRIAVEPEVSEISDEGAVQFGGFSVPGFITRRAQTVVELSPGESFMIAGLIQDELTSSVDSIPGIKEVPILGALFNSVSYQREETELVLAVTPYIVDPMVSSDVKLPTDDFRSASIMEMFFYGAIGSLHGDTDRLSQTPTTEGPIGFMVD